MHKKDKKGEDRIRNALQFSPFSDIDRDGVPNILDCQPTNPLEHGFWDWMEWAKWAKLAKWAKSRVKTSYRPIIRTALVSTRRTAQRITRQYAPAVSLRRVVEGRAVVERHIKHKHAELVKEVKKYIPEKREIAKIAIETIKVAPVGLVSKEVIKRLPELKKIKPIVQRVVEFEKKRSPGLIAAQIVKEKILPPIRKGYEISTGKYIAVERKALTGAQEARILQGRITAQQLGLPSEDFLRSKLGTITALSQRPDVKKYYSIQKGVSDVHIPEVEAYYKRVKEYQKIPSPTRTQHDALIRSKPSSVDVFESRLSGFEQLYPSKPTSVVEYEKTVKPFLTDVGSLKPSVLDYITKGEMEYGAFQTYQKKERGTREEWAPKYKGFKPYTYPTLEWGAKISKPLTEGIEKFIPKEYEKAGYGVVGGIKGAGLFVASLPEWAGTLPPSAELLVRKTPIAIASIPLGLGLMGGGIAKEFVERPEVATGRIAGMVLMPVVGKKLPIRYTGALKLPTGRSVIKTKFTLGGGLPKELVRAGRAGELVKFEPIGKTPIGKVTYQVPEVISYRGVYAARPSLSVLPWRGKTPLVGITTKGIKQVPRPSIGAPKLDIATFQPRTGAEAALLLPSIKRGLKPRQAKLMEAAFRDIELIGRQKSVIRRSIDLSLIENIPKEVRPTVLRMLKQEKGVVFGSAAQRTQQILRRSMEDVDYFVKNPEKVAERWVPQLNKAAGKEIFRHKGRGLIEVYKEGQWRHSIDMHSIAELKGRLSFGFKPYKPVKIEGIKYATLEEQLFRKSLSITQPRKKVISPELYRMKDIADFVSASKTLVESMQLSQWTKVPVYGKIKLRRAAEAGEKIKLWEQYAREHPTLGRPTQLKEFYPDIFGEAIPKGVKGEILAQRLPTEPFAIREFAGGIPLRALKFRRPKVSSELLELFEGKPVIKKDLVPEIGKAYPKVKVVDRAYYPVFGKEYYPTKLFITDLSYLRPRPKKIEIPKYAKSRPSKPKYPKYVKPYKPIKYISKGFYPVGGFVPGGFYPVGSYLPKDKYIVGAYPPTYPKEVYPPPITGYVPPPTPSITPPPTHIVPLFRIPPTITKPPFRPKKDEEFIKLRREPWAAIQTTVKNPILSADVLIKKML